MSAMLFKKSGIILALIALLASSFPAAPAAADGAASTRNIILGGALVGGTLLILNHNRKVHQKYDELTNARNQAQADRDQAYASYQSAASSSYAYAQRLAATQRELASYRHTLAMQHDEIVKLRHQIALRQDNARSAFVQPNTAKPPSPTVRVASESFGWGQL
ncbi:MAG: hypothetical protein JO359_00395 [Candidatus Eremiobacteraeota bacterium]|nr:hypothetical protein [Candidatus Eremiobacteraeota bacterium]